ncbi:MATE family efflux transporter [Flavobacterium sp. UMI-01]|uniref:MATE family efflux transporter n=1 Tax=Flavobacterium sp. UMI-01 TaxID=1441053 RepID=UPI001C7DD9CC|nr:MATE family efflux transporter [Flavobacterium sp. UMI-01]GIZ08581.1 MATE family efflux transporter [Flavobacterium sp. UMI-01]
MTIAAYTKEFSYNFKLAYPIIIGMLGHTVVGIVDNIMVGHIGPAELAAASLANSLVFVAMSLGIGFSTAITPMAAAADGKKDIPEGRTAFHHGLYLCTLLGVLLFGGILIVKPWMDSMGQPSHVVDLAKPFMNVIAFSLVPLIIFQGYKQFADGMSETKYAMWATLWGNIVNVVLNYVLIYGIWLFPKMGFMGAAVGTLVSRFVMLGYLHYKMKRKAKFHPFFEGFSLQKIQKKVNVEMIKLGAPSALQMFFEVGLFTAAVWLSGRLGVAEQAANQIALSLASFTFMFAMGLSVAATIRVGNQKGLKDYKKLRLVALSIFILAILLEMFFAVFFVLFHGYLPHWFMDSTNLMDLAQNKEVVEIASNLLLVAAVFQISDGIQVVMLGALRGLQDVKIPMYITFLAYWIVGFPICIWLGLFTALNAIGIWIGLLAGLSTAALFLYLRFNYLTKKMIAEASNNTSIN